MTDTIRALTDPLRVKSVKWFFWAVAIVFYGFGDTITTIFGLQATGVAEGGPLVLVVLALGGIPAFILYKTLLVAVFFGVWYVVSGPVRDSIPMVLTVLGVVITIWNTYVVFY